MKLGSSYRLFVNLTPSNTLLHMIIHWTLNEDTLHLDRRPAPSAKMRATPGPSPTDGHEFTVSYGLAIIYGFLRTWAYIVRKTKDGVNAPWPCSNDSGIPWLWSRTNSVQYISAFGFKARRTKIRIQRLEDQTKMVGPLSFWKGLVCELFWAVVHDKAVLEMAATMRDRLSKQNKKTPIIRLRREGWSMLTFSYCRPHVR